jgi:uncharacterized iron-regulated protein
MTRLFIAFILGFLIPSASPAQELPAPLATQIRKLEKDIAAVRGLPFKEAVKACLVARSKDGDPKLQGYYHLQEKTLYLYDDVAGNYQKGVLIHEMMHAWQDQHFNLGKLKAQLHKDNYDSDAELALAALIEGDATLTMIEVLRQEQPRVAAMLETPLEKARNLHNAFLYAQGARYVQALKEKGGWKSVDAAYRFPPRTTGAILNLKNISAINLGPGKSRGAFALLQMLAQNPATQSQALALAQTWRGDRVVEGKDGRGWVLAVASPADAHKLQETLVRWGQSAQATWPLEAKETLSVQAVGTRVNVVAALPENHQAWHDRLQGPLRLEVYAPRTKETISFGTLIERLLPSDVVCIGEHHDSDLHHRVQLQIIKALHAHDERLGVGLEMFQKPFQKVIDRYGAGEMSEADFLKDSEYWSRWGYEWSLYQPIVEFCRRNQLPLAALNAPRELTRRVSQAGFAQLTQEEKNQLGPIDLGVQAHRDYWLERLAKMHGQDNAPADQKERSYQVMAVWDDHMARTAAEFQKARQLRRLVLLAGSGHIERGFGIPARTARYGHNQVATVGIQIQGSDGEEPVTDYVIRVLP